MERVLGDKRAILILLGPALVVYSLIMLVPIVWSLGYTVLDGNPIVGFTFNGFGNFIKFFQDPAAWSVIWFTVRFAIVMTVLQVGAGFGLSPLYVFWLKRSSSAIRTIIFFPIVLPTVAVALLFQRLFEAAPTTGPVNSFLGLFGIESIDWFGTPDASFWILLLMGLWQSMGFYGVLLYAGLLDIPEEMLESARLDGAGGWKLIRTIVLPLSLPVLLSSLIFSINGTLKVFDSVVALTNGGPGNATTPLTVYMFQTSFTYGQYGYGSTIALMLTILCLIFTIFIFRSTRRDVTKG
ncbi:carbohydrate ABC transporter permease [Cryobacterium sp.]|jgi:raffinose/stachyose/melibiose transport system permease protein|uniref:carbohydrate ABC transporter permease n=1 Tax=Cryobacterium sp. TaxID=1926290 RepID=UPI0026084E5C|nr:sugar ABC transporter permease [Cryobacterium sp.]MCU1445219.1 transporter permease [Cryobacterium sp.]